MNFLRIFSFELWGENPIGGRVMINWELQMLLFPNALSVVHCMNATASAQSPKFLRNFYPQTIVTQRQLMRRFAVKLILSSERKVMSKFLKN